MRRVLLFHDPQVSVVCSTVSRELGWDKCRILSVDSGRTMRVRRCWELGRMPQRGDWLQQGAWVSNYWRDLFMTHILTPRSWRYRWARWEPRRSACFSFPSQRFADVTLQKSWWCDYRATSRSLLRKDSIISILLMRYIGWVLPLFMTSILCAFGCHPESNGDNSDPQCGGGCVGDLRHW